MSCWLSFCRGRARVNGFCLWHALVNPGYSRPFHWLRHGSR